LFVVLYQILLQLLNPQVQELVEQPFQDKMMNNVVMVHDDDDVGIYVNHLNNFKFKKYIK
jgi:hypothetical protein